LYATEITVRPRRVNEMGASDVAWIKMACDAAQGRAVVHTIVKHYPIKCGSLKELINGHFPTTVLNVVSKMLTPHINFAQAVIL